MSVNSGHLGQSEQLTANANSLKATLSTGDTLTQLLKILENPNSAENLLKIEGYTQEVSLLRAQLELLQENSEKERIEQLEF